MWYWTLENRFFDGTPNDVSIAVDGYPDSSGKWRRYKEGQSVPKKYGHSDPIANAEMVWHGTSEIWRSPTWPVLKGDRINQQAIFDGISDLGPTMKIIILGGGFSNYVPSSDDETGLERLFLSLTNFPSFELLQALILMLAWADNIRNPYLWNKICEFYRFMIPDLIDCGSIPCYEDYLSAIDDIALFREFTGANSYIDNRKCWKDELPRYEQMKVEREEQWYENLRNTPKAFAGLIHPDLLERAGANLGPIANFRRRIVEWRQRALRQSDPV
jgi:hypothetical protein